jgi:F-type H+-transporting ATPase subunit delta
MSENPLIKKVAAPYARAIFDFSYKKNVMHKVTADFHNLNIFFNENIELKEYLNNPVVTSEAKRETLTKILKSQIDAETFKLILIIVDCNRINILPAIISSYIELMYKTASVKTVEVSTALAFTNSQRKKLTQKLKKLIDAREVQLVTTVDPTLIGGFLIKTESKIIDFTVKNKLQQLAKHLGTVLEI